MASELLLFVIIILIALFMRLIQSHHREMIRRIEAFAEMMDDAERR